jgi:two-component system response regulator YesN
MEELQKHGKVNFELVYIVMNPGYNDKNLNLSTVAKHFHISGSHLSRVFHEEAGVSFINYLTDLRMREAESLLRDTYQSVAEVAYAVGYGNPNYFARIFQRRYGVPPSAYRDATCSDVKRNNSEEN